MGQYIINEFRKALKSRPSRIYIIAIAGACLLANVAVLAFRTIYGSNEGTFAYNILVYATWCFVIPYYSCIFIADIVYGEGRIRPGLSRTQFYLSKLSASVLLAMAFLLITVVTLFIVTILFHLSDGTIGHTDIFDFLEKMVYAIPLWLAGIGFANMFLFGFSDRKKAYIFYFLLTVVLERGIMLLAAEPFRLEPFRLIRTVTVTQLFSLIPYPADPARNIPLTVSLGFFYLIVSSGIGIYRYNRRK